MFRKWFSAGWLFLLASLLASDANAHSIRLAVNPWTGSAVNAAVAKLLLEERLGYEVELVAIDEISQFSQLASNQVSATLEIWPSGHQERIQQFIETDGTVENLGLLGTVGKIGWYVPRYLVEQYPYLSTWEGIKTNTALFRTSASGTQGQFLQGDPTWTYKDEQIITNLGLDLKIVQTGSEASLIAEVERAYTNREPVLFYFWTPHSIHSKLDLVEVTLPPYSEGCTGCDYPSENLFKAASSSLRTNALDVWQFLKNFQLGNADQIHMIAEIELNGRTPEEAARRWLEAQPESWLPWFNDVPTVVNADRYAALKINATMDTSVSVQSTTNVAGPWTPFTNVVTYTTMQSVLDPEPLTYSKFYRATASSQVTMSVDVHYGLRIFDNAGVTYRVEQQSGSSTNWNFAFNVALPENNPLIIDYNNPARPDLHYRIIRQP